MDLTDAYAQPPSRQLPGVLGMVTGRDPGGAVGGFPGLQGYPDMNPDQLLDQLGEPERTAGPGINVPLGIAQTPNLANLGNK